MLFKKLNEATVTRTLERGRERLRGETLHESLDGSCRTQRELVRNLDFILNAMGNHWRALGKGGTD